MEIQKVKNRFGRVVSMPSWKAEKMIKNDEAKIMKTESVSKKRGRPSKK